MFNETSYFNDAAARFPIKAFHGNCPSGENLVDVGGDAPICLSVAEAQAYYDSVGASGSPLPSGSLGTVNVNAGGLDWTTIAIYGGVALFALAIFTGGRRR